jgi:putative flippase GtrA
MLDLERAASENERAPRDSTDPTARQAKLAEHHRVARFLVVGAVGFLVDGGVLSLLVHGFGIGPIIARGPSFLSAVTVTWLLNRAYTFHGLRAQPIGAQYVRYLAAQGVGALTNLGVYASAIYAFAICARIPVLALALGSAVALVVNYLLLRLFVFHGRGQA